MYAHHIEQAVCRKLEKIFGYGLKLTSLEDLMVIEGSDQQPAADLSAEFILFEKTDDYVLSEVEQFISVGSLFLDGLALDAMQELAADFAQAA